MTLIEKKFAGFLKEFCSDNPLLLLGLSGGPDSMTLFHLLLQEGYPFEAAHVDHGWRPESGEESAILSKLCLEKGIPFHVTKLPPCSDTHNLEEKGRMARLFFFKNLVAERGFKGIFLAHHADDHAETVLKRLFEGASLPKLRGLLPKAEVSGVTIYRPLLKIRKQEMAQWLSTKNIFYFNDPTNEDARFLRTRLRHELLPALSDRFGKEITDNLCHLGESAAELQEFLEGFLVPYRAQVERVSDALSLDFNQNSPSSLFLWKAVVRDFFEQQRLTLPRSVLHSVLDHLIKGNCHKILILGKHTIKIHKKKITVFFGDPGGTKKSNCPLGTR